MKDTAARTDAKRGLAARTLWRIETHLAEPLSLAQLAAWEGVSPFHLARAFALITGQAPMNYVRKRRLSRAAHQLRNSDARIIEIALDAGYDSHEGFSRAMRDQFDQSPSAIRSHSDEPLDLQEALVLPQTQHPALSPRFVERADTRLVGLSRRFTMETRAQIPQHWLEEVSEIGHAMHDVPTFGAAHDFDGEHFSYLVGIRDDGRLDTERLDHVLLPKGEYAVFEHAGHISTISETWTAIFEAWLPNSGVTPTDGPEFEQYETHFDPEKPGGVSIWIPITREA